MQAGARLVRPNFQLPTQVQRPLVQSLAHFHDADTGAFVSGKNCSLYRRGSSPARQQRGVHVDAGEARQVKHGFRQQQAIGDNDDHIRPKAEQCFLYGGRFERFGLLDS